MHDNDAQWFEQLKFALKNVGFSKHPGAKAYMTSVAPLMGAPSLSTPTAGPGQGQDGKVDIWHTVPSDYECVLFPFYSGAGNAMLPDLSANSGHSLS